MPPTLEEQINQLKGTIVEMEAQRTVLGDEFVDSTLDTLRDKLAELDAKTEQLTKETSVPPTRQRKLVTLLYLDVVSSTAMTQHLDPEDTMEIMDNAMARLAQPIQEHSGRITRYTGDGFKAVFGDPVAREDDPEQAIRAGLEILELTEVLAREIEQGWDIENFQVRIGTDTGLAALGGQTEGENTVKGRVVNLAVRIESAAPPGGILISHNTYRHVRGVFNVDPQDPISAKGFPEPVPVYLVRDIKPRAFRVQTRGVEGIETRMVGRHDELKYLQDALLTVIEEGEGQVVTISGEAGVGKSRLLYEFQNWIELLPPSNAVRFFQGRGRQEAQGLPYSLLRDLFAFRFKILDDDSGEQARQKIEAGFCEILGNDGEDIMRAHILGQLLGFDFSASTHLRGVLNDPEQLRNRARMYLVQYFQELSKEIPVVIFLEDLHWADNSSLDLVMHLGDHTPELRLLIVSAARPILFEQRPYWGEGQEYHTHLELRPLSKRESRQLVAEILQLAEEIPSQLRELLVRGAEGNPFYLEELIKLLIEDGVVTPSEETWEIDVDRIERVDVPSTLAGVLQARLDSLPIQERTVLQQASVVGRLFWDRIVAHIQAKEDIGGDPLFLPHAFTSLRNREMIYRHEESAFADSVEYLFKHDVLREVTYESVIRRLRKTYHGLVADWLIANSGDRIGEYSGLIADHLVLAGRKDYACQYYIQAGDTALASYSNSEAEGFYQQAIELSPHEFLRANLLTGLGEAFSRLGQSDEAKLSWRNAIDLYQQLEDSDHIADVYARLSRMTWYKDNLAAWYLCQEALNQLDSVPESPGYASLLAEAGRTARFANAHEQVIILCQSAQEMAERLGCKEVQVEAKITLGLQKYDITESIAILEDTIKLAEENKLLRSASRAHLVRASFMVVNIDMDIALQHSLKAAEYARDIGDIESLMFSLNLVHRKLIELGELNTADSTVVEFASQSLATDSRIDSFLIDSSMYLLYSQGDWLKAAKVGRIYIGKLRHGGKKQLIHFRNIDLTKILLELDRFNITDTLAEAELALKENFKIKWEEADNFSLMACVLARQGRLSEAQNWFEESLNAKDIDELDLLQELYRSLAEFEIAFGQEQWGQAIKSCEYSIELVKDVGYRWEWARKLIDLGDALIGRSEPGDLERALETYQQSLDMFTQMGAPGYIQVLEERLKDM